MNKHLFKFILLFLGFSLYFSCVDDGVYVPGESHKVPETDLMAYAKQLVGENGEGCSLIDFQKDNPHSRSVTDYSTVATPLWEKAKHERLGDLEVLVVPLQSEQEIHSGMYFEQEHMERLFQTKTFSRLVIRSKGGKTLSQVFTYLPGRHYAKHRKEELDTMGFSPLSVKYYGTILISGLDGKFQQGFLYERGVPVVHFTKRKDSNSVPIRLLNDSMESECHSHDHAHSFPVRLKLTGNPTVASRSYDEGDEDIWAGYCPACGSTDIDHTCVVVWGTPSYCDQCGRLKKDCVCEFACPFCGKLNCICCLDCGRYPCVCEPPEDSEESLPKCEHCGKEGCKGECLKPEPDDDEPEEVAPKAKKMFRNSNMTEANWKKLEAMLDKIIADCLGNNLYNGLLSLMNGGTFTIQFKDVGVLGGGFGYINGAYGIILDQRMESNQLLHEMMHAYRSYKETPDSYINSTMNGEIEAYYAQYLYTSRLPEYKNSKWEKQYNVTKSRSMAIKKLEKVIDHKGNLRDENSRSLLAEKVNDLINVMKKSTTYSNPKYIYDANRDVLSNFDNLRTLTIDCL